MKRFVPSSILQYTPGVVVIPTKSLSSCLKTVLVSVVHARLAGFVLLFSSHDRGLYWGSPVVLLLLKYISYNINHDVINNAEENILDRDPTEENYFSESSESSDINQRVAAHIAYRERAQTERGEERTEQSTKAQQAADRERSEQTQTEQTQTEQTEKKKNSSIRNNIIAGKCFQCSQFTSHNCTTQC
jgi:hypothetical protein